MERDKEDINVKDRSKITLALGIVMVLCLCASPVTSASAPSAQPDGGHPAGVVRASQPVSRPQPTPPLAGQTSAYKVPASSAATTAPDPNAALQAAAAKTSDQEPAAPPQAPQDPPVSQPQVAAYQHQYEWTGAAPIVDNTCPGGGITQTIHVPDAFTITDLYVGFSASHSYRSDVSARLTSPSGTTARLLRDPDGGADNLDALLENGAPAPDSLDHDTAAPYYEHGRRPARSLSAFAGENAQGDWSLYVCDDAGGDEGTLHRWALFFNRFASANLTPSSKSAAAHVRAGDELLYTIVLSNTGPLSATNALLVDAIPAGTVFAYTVTPPSLVYNPALDAVEWRGTLATSDILQLSFAVDVDDALACGTVITNAATMSWATILTTTVATLTLESATHVWSYAPFQTDLEGDDGGFSALQGEWEWGTPMYPPGLTAHSGSSVWGTDLDGDADDTIGDHTLTRMIDVPPSDSAVLTWWDWYGLESDDALRVYVDNTLVHQRAGTSQRQWIQHSIDLGPWSGQRVELRFDLNVCCEDPGPDGWYLDDIVVMACPPDPGLYLLPSQIETFGCTGAPQTHILTLHNWTGAAGSFDLTYTLADPGYGTFDGPTSAVLPDSTYATITTTLTPDICLPSGVEVAGNVEASSNGYSASSLMTTALTSQGLWELRAPMPTPRGDLTVVNGGNGALYAIGGTVAGGTPNGENERYDLTTGVWTAAAPMPVQLTIMDGDLLGNRIYVPGGYSGTSFVAATLAYHVGNNSWAGRAPAPRAAAGYAAAACSELLYRSGGGGYDTWPNASRALEVYDPATNTWATLASMAHGHLWHAMACIEGKLYVAGGMDESGNPSATAEVYDIASDTWSDSAMADLPTSWWGPADFVEHGRMALAGGIVGGSPSAAVIFYDPTTDSWTYGASLNDARFRLDGNLAGDSGAALGGWDPLWTPHYSHEFLVQCPECALRGWIEGYVHDYDNVAVPCSD